MEITLLKSKLHTAHITHIDLEYEGSCAIDAKLLEQADIMKYEQIDIYNLNNGERFTTYAVPAKANSGTISLLGAAAHKALVGDRVIICTYARMDAQVAKDHQPTVLCLDNCNKVIEGKGQHTPLRSIEAL